MSWAALLLAAALLVGADSTRVRLRVGLAAPAGRSQHRAADRAVDPLAAASSFDVLAACLSSGMAVSGAAAATAPSAPPPLARLLNRAADLLALGADPATAWSNPAPPVGGTPRPPLDKHGEALLRLARRSASSGTALAQAVAELATQYRHDAADAAGAAAERASVLIAGPLGLCYLPAFLCLGIIPVVAGLAGDLLRSGVW
jgi:pilus assembly protein TadC